MFLEEITMKMIIKYRL